MPRIWTIGLTTGALVGASLLGLSSAGASSLQAASWDSRVMTVGSQGTPENASIVIGPDGGAGLASFVYPSTDNIVGAVMSPQGVWDDSVVLNSTSYPYPNMRFAQSQAAIVSTGPGTYLAVWVQMNQNFSNLPVASRYDGTAWLVDDSLTAPFAGASASPSINQDTLAVTVDPRDGAIYVSAIKSEGTDAWMVSKSTDGGATWSNPIVSDSSGVVPVETQTSPSAVIAGGRLYLVGLDDNNNSNAYIWTLDLSTFGDNTPTWSAQPFTSPALSGNDVMPTAIAASDDSLIVAWVEPYEYWVGWSTSNDGGQTWADDTFVDGYPYGSDWHEAVVVSPYGFVYVYTTQVGNPYDIRVRTSLDGVNWSAARDLATGMPNVGERNVAAATDEAGNMLISWIDDNATQVWSQLYQGKAGQWDDSVTVGSFPGIRGLSAAGGPATRFGLVFNSPNSTDQVASVSSASPYFVQATPPTSAAVGAPFPAYTFMAQAWPAPVYSVAVGSIPPGMSLDGNTGVLSGTPTASGSFTFQVEAANSQAPSTQTDPITITVTGGGTVAATPASAPRDAAAVAGDASATVSWAAPASTGSFPVSNYLVTSSPGGHSCLASSTSCDVSGLSNGTAYTFTVQALSGAGWSAASAPSNAVVPRASDTTGIVITGSRDGKRIVVKGSATGMGMGGELNPYLRLAGEFGFTQGSATILVNVDGSFEWSRRSGKRVSVYIATPDGSMRSNTVTIPGRQGRSRLQ